LVVRPPSLVAATVSPIRERRPVDFRRFATPRGILSLAGTLPPPGRRFGARTAALAFLLTPARIVAVARLIRQALAQLIRAKTKLRPWDSLRTFTV